MKAKSFLLGFIIGGAAAGISTILSAPATGKETRKFVIERKDYLKQQISELKGKIGQIKNSTIIATKEGKIAIPAFVSETNELIKNWKAEILPHQQELQKELHEIEKAIQELENNLNKNQQIANND